VDHGPERQQNGCQLGLYMIMLYMMLLLLLCHAPVVPRHPSVAAPSSAFVCTPQTAKLYGVLGLISMAPVHLATADQQLASCNYLL